MTEPRDIRPLKGRGAVSNPEGRFESLRVTSEDDGWYQEALPESVATVITPERAKTIITTNDSPDVGFEYSINPYRGCEHGCVYCASGDTAVLLANGASKPLGDVRVGDEIYGTVRRGHYRRYVRTKVIAHWRTLKRAYRVTLADGTELVASADHRFLTERGWKFVARNPAGSATLTPNNSLLGFGTFRASGAPEGTAEYRRGYLAGVVHGDGHLASYKYARAGRSHGDQHQFRLAMIDAPALDRTARFLLDFGISTHRFVFAEAGERTQRIEAIRTHAKDAVESIQRLVALPDRHEGEWARGFLAGIFDAEGSYSQGVLRIANSNERLIAATCSSLTSLGFACITDTAARGRQRPMSYVRIRGGLSEHLKFFRACLPAIDRKCSIAQQAVKSRANLRVVSIEALPGERELFDITTGTGDFIASGVISHNCYARPAHSYIGLSPGLDFETKLFYKADAANVLERDLSRPGYVCKPIMIGANTDPYQPIERKLEVTRSVLKVLAKCRHPVTLITKGSLIVRDIDLLADLAKDHLTQVAVSLTSLDADIKRTLEPRTASPQARLRVIRQLAEAGIPVSVMVAPVVPAITDHEMEHLLEAAHEAGARSAGYVLLRLPYEVKALFREWLAEHYPDRAAHVMSLVNEMRGGRDNDPNFGTRMSGTGPYAQLLRQRFQVACRRLGMNGRRDPALTTSHFHPPVPAGAQFGLDF
jgi:DNA repair photolyase